MEIGHIIAELEAERDRLDEAIAALGGKRERSAAKGRRSRRFRTAAERKRISDSMKKSWAARKKAEVA